MQSKINLSHVPNWMLPKQKASTPVTIKKPQAVLDADQMTQLSINIIWQRDLKFDGYDELLEAIQEARAQNLDIPDTKQVLKQDPRLLTSLAPFKDAIRRQYSCQLLLINIRTLELSYRDDTGQQTSNVLKSLWSATKSTFEDKKNLDFVLSITFEALDDKDENIFESFEPAPAFANMFDVSSGDVLSNEAGRASMLDTALAVDQDDSTLPTTDDMAQTDGMQAIMSLTFGAEGSVTDIGAPPVPK
jgi:hypothetical protein